MNYIVCGPPGSGKSSYVAEHRKHGDLIVDVDALYHAITGLPYYDKPNTLLDLVLGIRDMIVANIPRYRDRFYNAWIITSGARLDERNRLAIQLKAQVIVLAVPAGECMRRISKDPRRAANMQAWQDIVNGWWRRYERCDADTIVKPDWEQ
jgi:predicted kinase